MFEYNKVNVKLPDTQLKKLKTAAKIYAGTTLRMSFKMCGGNDLPHELLLTTRQRTKLRNAFNNGMSTDTKLSKAQISKIKLRNAFNNNMSTEIKLSKTQVSKMIESGGFLESLSSKLAGTLIKIAFPLAKTHFSSIRNNSICFSS